MGNPLTDSAIGKNRQDLMTTVMGEHESALLRYTARITNSATAAQDVVQNVFIKLFRGWEEGMHPTRNLKAWLYRVAHNEAIDYIRRESRLQVLHMKHAEEQKQVCPDGRNCAGAPDEKRQLVLQHVRKLHSREQQVLMLRLEEGLSYEEISKVTGRTPGNVGNILHHAVKKLSKSLQKEDAIWKTAIPSAGA